MSELMRSMKLKGEIYSPNIAKFARKRGSNIRNVLLIPYCSINGFSSSEKGTLYFSYHADDESLSGAKVLAVRCGQFETFCWVGNADFLKALSHRVDVTEWFIKNYKQYGKCCFGDDHHHDFVQINKKSRRCKICGKIERRTIQNKTTYQRKEIWEAA